MKRIKKVVTPFIKAKREELGLADDLVTEANATGAEDAALGVQRDTRAEVDGLGFVHFCLGKLAFCLAVINAVFLQLTLACLVADGAVERMVDE